MITDEQLDTLSHFHDGLCRNAALELIEARKVIRTFIQKWDIYDPDDGDAYSVVQAIAHLREVTR